MAISLASGKPLEFTTETVEKFGSSKKGTGLMRGEWTHGKSVSAAYWDPRGRSIVSTSYDDTLRRKLSLIDYVPNSEIALMISMGLQAE